MVVVKVEAVVVAVIVDLLSDKFGDNLWLVTAVLDLEIFVSFPKKLMLLYCYFLGINITLNMNNIIYTITIQAITTRAFRFRLMQNEKGRKMKYIVFFGTTRTEIRNCNGL